MVVVSAAQREKSAKERMIPCGADVKRILSTNTTLGRGRCFAYQIVDTRGQLPHSQSLSSETRKFDHVLMDNRLWSKIAQIPTGRSLLESCLCGRYHSRRAFVATQESEMYQAEAE